MHTPKVYIVILNYKTWTDTIECVESLLQLDYTNFNIVIVDNNSPNDSVIQIEAWLKSRSVIEKELPSTTFSFQVLQEIEIMSKSLSKVTLIKSISNKGYAFGNNIGLKYALQLDICDFLWILNNDTIVAPNCLSELVAYYDSKNNIGVLGARVMHYYSPMIIQGVAGRYNPIVGKSSHVGDGVKNIDELPKYQAFLDYDYVMGVSMFVSKSYCHEVGLLNEMYFLYFEELSWCLEGRAKGFEPFCCFEAVVFHKEGKTINGNNTRSSMVADYNFFRSKLLFSKKYLTFAYVLLAYLGVFPMIFNRIKRRQFKRIPKLLSLLFLIPKND